MGGLVRGLGGKGQAVTSVPRSLHEEENWLTHSYNTMSLLATHVPQHINKLNVKEFKLKEWEGKI